MATAAEDDAPMAQVETLLTCSICLEILNDPRTLDCFHSFCKECLKNFVKTKRREAEAEGKVIEIFNCPECRAEFTLKQEENVEGMTRVPFIRNMIEIVTIQQRAKHLPCFFCGSNAPAVCRCVRCERYLCKKCLTTHQSWPDFKDHTVLTIEELAKPENQAKARGKSRCVKHEKVNKFFCESCAKLVCTHCIVLDHPKPDHSCKPVNEVVNKHKDSLKTSAAVLDEELQEGNAALQAIENNIQKLNNNAKKAKEDVIRHKKEILQAFTRTLEEKVNGMIEEIDKKYDEVNERLTKQHDEMKYHTERVRMSHELTRKLVHEGNHEDILTFRTKIEETIQKTKEERPKYMEPIHSGCMGYKGRRVDIGMVPDKLGDVVCHAVEPVYRLCANSLVLNVQYEYAKQLREWLSPQFQWRLAYRASIDGWSAQDFHRCCDDKGPTVTLVKVGEYIFGGYTDQSWAGEVFKQSKLSFLFSLRNKDNLPPFKSVVYRNSEYAIRCNPSWGPTFGQGHDLVISNNANTNQQSLTDFGETYRPPPGYNYDTEQTDNLLAGTYYFTPTEIEVFY